MHALTCMCTCAAHKHTHMCMPSTWVWTLIRRGRGQGRVSQFQRETPLEQPLFAGCRNHVWVMRRDPNFDGQANTKADYYLTN